MVVCTLRVEPSRVRVLLACTGALPGQGSEGCASGGTVQQRHVPPLPPDREEGWIEWL